MRKIKVLLLGCFIAFTAISCFEDRDDNLIAASEINDFVWKAMNVFYVYKNETPDLANGRFSTNEDYAQYLNSFSTPEALFESLIYLPNDVDEFSDITDNYFELEQVLQGTTLNDGMEFGLVRIPNSNSVFGYVRYVLPNSSAESQGVTRGMLFNAVNGTVLTVTNFQDLLFNSNIINYVINLATYNDNGTPDDTSDDNVDPTDNSISLTREVITENPILVNNVIETNGFKIGYLMYNGFRFSNNSLTELNNAFGDFNLQNIDELVLDLRYNGGGSVDTAIWLSSMITGQFTGDLFFKEEWNEDIQTVLESTSPEDLTNLFVDTIEKRNSDNDITFQQNINSLNLSKIYILTSRSTASASELVINGLRPHINVVQIGRNTRGKPQASVTLYDSENFQRENANPNHTYALQPLIYEAANKEGVSDYYDGLAPTIGFELSEDYGNLGILGDVNEPLLERAIFDITGAGRLNNRHLTPLETIPDEKYKPRFSQEMFVSRLPIN